MNATFYNHTFITAGTDLFRPFVWLKAEDLHAWYVPTFYRTSNELFPLLFGHS